jgi:hypothetical protein
MDTAAYTFFICGKAHIRRIFLLRAGMISPITE